MSLFSKRKDVHDHDHSHGYVQPPTPEVVDLHDQYLGSWGGQQASFVDTKGVLNSAMLVSSTEPDFYASSTKHNVRRATKCAKQRMGAEALSVVVAVNEHAGYVIPSKLKNVSVGGPSVVASREVVGPLALQCVDIEGVQCPIAETCSFVKDFASKQMFTLGGIVTVEVPHYTLPPQQS